MFIDLIRATMNVVLIWSKQGQIIKTVLRNSRLEYRQVQKQQFEMHRYDNTKSNWKLLTIRVLQIQLKHLVLKVLLIILRP